MPNKISELRNQSDQELKERIETLKKEYYELRLSASVGNVDKPAQFRKNRLEVAQIKTLIRERELKNVSKT